MSRSTPPPSQHHRQGGTHFNAGRGGGGGGFGPGRGGGGWGGGGRGRGGGGGWGGAPPAASSQQQFGAPPPPRPHGRNPNPTESVQSVGAGTAGTHESASPLHPPSTKIPFPHQQHRHHPPPQQRQPPRSSFPPPSTVRRFDAGTGGGPLPHEEPRPPQSFSSSSAAPPRRHDSDDDPDTRWSRMTRSVAHYERIEQIGEGTYGQVYRARDLLTGRIVALKKIRLHHGGYWGTPPTVIREIKILKRLSHPNMVEMIEVVSSKGYERFDDDDEREDERRRKRKEAAAAARAREAAKERGAGEVGGSGVEGSTPDPASKRKKDGKKDRAVDLREGYKGNLFLVLEYVSHDLTGLMDMAYRFTEVQVKCVFRQLLDVLSYIHESKYVHRDIKSSNILIDSQFRVKLADFGLSRSMEVPLLDNASE